jgi:O-antigen/teichoic acid export membrane protein
MNDRARLGSRSTMLRSIGWLGAAEGGQKLGLVLSTLIVARALGATAFGQWSFVLTLTGLIAMVSDLGLPNATTKQVAVGGEDPAGVIGAGMAMKLCSSAVAYAGIVVFALASRQSAELVGATLVLGVFGLCNTYSLYMQAVFRSMAKTHLEALARIFQQVVTLALLGALLMKGAGLVAFAMVYAGASIAGLALTLVLLEKTVIAATLRFELVRWKALAVEAWPFWVTGLLWLAYFRLDIVLLSYMSTDRQVGLYNMAYNGFQVLTMPATVIVLALFPSFAHLHQREPGRFARLRVGATGGAMALAVVVAAAAALAAGPVIDLVIGREYADSLLLFRVLTAALIFLYPNYVLMYTLMAANRRRIVVAATATGAFTNVALNLVLIRTFDALGASIATLGTEATVFCVLATAAWLTSRTVVMAEPASPPAMAAA